MPTSKAYVHSEQDRLPQKKKIKKNMSIEA